MVEYTNPELCYITGVGRAPLSSPVFRQGSSHLRGSMPEYDFIKLLSDEGLDVVVSLFLIWWITTGITKVVGNIYLRA
jgi:hypothetical protein